MLAFFKEIISCVKETGKKILTTSKIDRSRPPITFCGKLQVFKRRGVNTHFIHPLGRVALIRNNIDFSNYVFIFLKRSDPTVKAQPISAKGSIFGGLSDFQMEKLKIDPSRFVNYKHAPFVVYETSQVLISTQDTYQHL